MYNNLIAFLTSFILIVCAEMGDKTQLLVINFASKYKVYKVLIGIFIGALCSNFIAILIGTYINNVPGIDEIIKLIACLIFIIFGFFNALEYRKDNEEKDNSNDKLKIFSSGIVTVALAIFLGEMGDKTNLSTLALTTQFEANYIYILLGATLAMVASNILSIFIGSIIHKKLKPKSLNILSTVLFMIFGIIGLTMLINQYTTNIFYTTIFGITLSTICIIICNRLYHPKIRTMA